MGVYKGQQPNIFRAVSGSLFSSPINWSRGYVPTGSDVATIADNCTIDINRTVSGLVVRPGFTASINTGLTLRVNDVINVLGHLSCSGTPNVVLLGKKNNISSLSPASSSFSYSGSINQNVPGLTYYNLFISNPNTFKYSTGNQTILNNLTIDGTNTTFELGQYNLIVSGTLNSLVGPLQKSQPGNITVLGPWVLGNVNLRVNFGSGNPYVELRNGWRIGGSNPSYTAIASGINTWYFSTTPTQSIGTWSSIFPSLFDAPILIGSGVSLFFSASGFSALDSAIYLTSPFNGVDSTSTAISKGVVGFLTSASLGSMTTGSFDIFSFPNTVFFGGNYSAILPNKLTNNGILSSLSIGGTGTKTLATSSYLSGSLTINSPGILELSSSNLIVSGATTIGSGATLQKTSAGGTASFYGLPTVNTNGNVNFSGNPYVEFRNGLQLGPDNPNITPGTGSWVFNTNNQSIYNTNGPGSGATLYLTGSVLVSGPISLSLATTAGSRVTLGLYAPIDGNHPSSYFSNASGILAFYTSASTNCMATSGTIDYSPFITSSLIGTWSGLSYLFSGNYTLPLSIYNNLYIGASGVIGIKSLSTNTTLRKSLTLNSGSTLEMGSYNLIVSGSTSAGSNGAILSKSGSGTVTFVGNINTGYLDFSIGNPTVEIQNGIIFNDNSPIFRSGTGSWYFTTNNQSLTRITSLTNGPTYSGSLIISGAIRLSVNHQASGLFVGYFNSYIDGTEAGSSFTSAETIYYRSSIMPMRTGSFDMSSSLNTFIYDSTANQDIRGGVYRNLTLSGSTKTLQGNVSVLNTLITSSATINFNGFTLTNP